VCRAYPFVGKQRHGVRFAMAESVSEAAGIAKVCVVLASAASIIHIQPRYIRFRLHGMTATRFDNILR
jgi:hypothetical protein